MRKIFESQGPLGNLVLAEELGIGKPDQVQHERTDHKSSRLRCTCWPFFEA
ncbi:MAG: hypothetical protein QXY83_01130 [Thermosphaera sp.]